MTGELYCKETTKAVGSNFEVLHHSSDFFSVEICDVLLSETAEVKTTLQICFSNSEGYTGSRHVLLLLWVMPLHKRENKFSPIVWFLHHKNYKHFKFRKNIFNFRISAFLWCYWFCRKISFEQHLPREQNNYEHILCPFNTTCLLQLKVKISKY